MIQGFPKPWDMKMPITTRPRIAMIGKNNTVKEKRNPERKRNKRNVFG